MVLAFGTTMYGVLPATAWFLLLFAAAATTVGAVVVAPVLRRRKNNRVPPISTMDAKPDEHPVDCRKDDFTMRREMSSNDMPDELQLSGAEDASETVDLHPDIFFLRWNPGFGTYATPRRTREETQKFRGRVLDAFANYVKFGLDAFALRDVVSKSTAFTAAERVEIIEDILKNY
jgi:hypothetical protein